jgi:hypothetical protein
MKRLHALVALLESRNDYLPTVQGARLASAPGPAAGDQVPCRHARVVTVDGRPELTCTCHGGWRDRIATLDGDQTADDFGTFDQYTYAADRLEHPTRVRTFGHGSTQTMSTKEIDAELARLRRDERTRAGITDRRDAYGWELAKRRRDKQGSHPQLERALEQLRLEDPEGHGLIVGHFCEKRYSELSVKTHHYLGRALIELARRMPADIRVPQALTDNLNGQARSAQVIAIHRRTGSISAAAKESGLRRGRVRYLLRQARAI